MGGRFKGPSRATPALEYAHSDRASRLGWLTVGAIAVALLCFPLGVGVSVFLEEARKPPMVSHRLAEWSGFLTFAVGAAGGLSLSVYGLVPRRWRRATPGSRVTLLIAMILNTGALALAVVLLAKWKG